MSSLPRIEASMPRATLPESAGVASGAAAPGSEFAEVMRSIFSPVHASTSVSHLSTASVSSRSQPSRSQPSQSQSSSGKYPSLGGENASSDVASKSTQANQVQSSDSSAEGANGAGGNSSTSSAMSSQDAVQGGDGSAPTPSQTIGPAQSAEIAARFGGAAVRTAAKGNSGSAARVAKLSAAPDGKELPSVSSANTNGVAGATVSPAVATNVPAAQTFGSTPAGANTAGDVAGTSKTPGKAATGQPSVVESLKKDRFLLNEVGISGEGTASLPNLTAATQSLHAEHENGATPAATANVTNAANAKSSSESNQDIGSNGSASASLSAGNAGDSSAKNSASDAVGSSDASATGAQGTAGNNDPSPDIGNASPGNASLTHSTNSTATNSSASALPGPNVAAGASAGASLSFMPPGTGTPHEAAAGAGTPNGPSAFSASAHSSVPGNPGIPSASSAGGRASSDTFAALDSAASGERGVLLHAASHQVSVGIADPSLGWVEVRAERIAGQVTAALAANSAASHAALTSILPSMATYLQEHHSGVQQLHVETGLAGGQSGTGSQGQLPSQSDARAGAENTAVANPVGNGWTAASQSAAPIAAARGTSASIKDHRFSIHA
jgi:hypothetical protein